MGNKLAKQGKPLRCQFTGKNRDARDISTRSVEASDETKTNRIIAAYDNDRNCTGRPLSRCNRRDYSRKSLLPDDLPGRWQVLVDDRTDRWPSDIRLQHWRPRNSQSPSGPP